MTGFECAINTVQNVQNNLNEFLYTLQKSDSNPELLLLRDFLSNEQERMYILSKLMTDFGEENFNRFIEEYFNSIIKALNLKIPVQEIVLKPTYYNDEYVIVGIMDDVPRMIINTFEKAITFIPDDYVLEMQDQIDECQNLISSLEEQLEYLSLSNDKYVFGQKRHEAKLREETNAIVAQLGVEKQTLAKLRNAVEEYQDSMLTQDEILQRYASRLVSYYQYVIIKTEDSEQYIP